MNKYDVIMVGTGEIGRPLYELFNGVYKTLAVDPIHFPENINMEAECDWLHVCIPGGVSDFESVTLAYIEVYKPSVVCVHSTVIPGTTESIQKNLDVPIVHTPAQGKHAGNNMKKDMLRYPKYLGVPEIMDNNQLSILKKHFEMVGFSIVKIVVGTKNTEWQKVLATSAFGWQIAWAQEVERICDKFNLNFDMVTDIYNYIEDIIPPHYPGIIGGHCVIPNIELVSKIHDSSALKFIKESNELKKIREDS